ncbi:MAG TPA: hypothetical protein VHK88_07800, partial [Aquihabitans sp.]|nr:hypothetical protein [Aquihabitans sp.]
VQQNTGNSKIDAYLQRDVTYRATVDARTGALEARVEVVLRNEVPSTDLPRVVVGNGRGLPNGTSASTVTVFTPHQVTAASIDGRPLVLARSEEAGLGAWDLPLVAVPPGGAATIVLELAGGVDLARGYRFRYLPQPVANPDRLDATVEVRGGRFTSAGPGRRLSFDGSAEEPRELSSQVRR